MGRIFLMLAKLAATRSTCLAFPVGAVVVKNKQLWQLVTMALHLVRLIVQLKDTAILA
jgi:hypothetical protein